MPTVFPGIDLQRMTVVDSLLVGTGTNDLRVYQLDEQSVPTLLSTTPLEGFVSRVRVVEGEVYLIPQSGQAWRVELVVQDLRGRRLATLLDQQCPPGGHRVQWLGRDDRGRELPSGTYLVQLRTESAVRSTKAVLVR